MKFAQDENKDLLIKLGLGVAAFFLGKDLYNKYKKDSAENQMDSDPASGQASSIKQALNPSGMRWMRYFDGTDKNAIMAIATQITNLDQVKEKYSSITEGDSLYDDLQGALSPDEFQKFLSLATKGKAGSWYYSQKSENVPANRWVVTKAEANVRRTPLFQPRILIGDNIVMTVPKNRVLGATTGKYAYDEKFKVLFIEFWTLKKDENKRATYFVAKSQVDILTKQEYEAKEKVEGKLQLQVLEGIGSNNDPQNQEVVSIGTTEVLDSNMQQISKVPKNTILGFPLMTLDTGKGKFTQIKTIQGLLRWVKTSQVLVRQRGS